jgi:hypothetical protein
MRPTIRLHGEVADVGDMPEEIFDMDVRLQTDRNIAASVETVVEALCRNHPGVVEAVVNVIHDALRYAYIAGQEAALRQQLERWPRRDN